MTIAVNEAEKKITCSECGAAIPWPASGSEAVAFEREHGMKCRARSESGTVFLDTESLSLASDPGKSWSEVNKLGLACAVTYEAEYGWREWIGDHPGHPEALAIYLDDAKKVIAHNAIRFDLPLIAGAVGIAPEAFVAQFKGRVVDTWADVREATGRMVGLDALARGTLHRGKSGVGAVEVPRFWELGFRAEVLLYCRKDVELLRDIYLAGIRGPLRYSATAKAPGGTARVKWRLR